MKKVKLILWIVIIGIFGLAVYQNQDFFLSRHSLGLDLYFSAYRSIALPNAVLFAAFFLIGWLIAYIFSLSDRYQSSRTIKSLRQTTTNQQNAIDSLRKDIGSLKTDRDRFSSGRSMEHPDDADNAVDTPADTSMPKDV